MEQTLLKALKDNNYRVPSDFDAMKLYEELIPVKGKHVMGLKSLSMVGGHLRALIINELPGISLEKEILLECALAYEHLLIILAHKVGLVDAPMKFRIFFDNIRKYYRSIGQKALITKQTMYLLDVCGAECHLGSIISKNVSKELTDMRDLFWSSAYALTFDEMRIILIDMITKSAKKYNAINFLAASAAVETAINIGVKMLERVENAL